jgi:hypothetical protein
MKKIFNYNITCNLNNFYLSIKEADYFIYKSDNNLIVVGENEDYKKCMNIILDVNSINTDNPIEKEYDGYIEIYKTVIYDSDISESKLKELKKSIIEKVKRRIKNYIHFDIMEMKKFIEKYEKEI